MFVEYWIIKLMKRFDMERETILDVLNEVTQPGKWLLDAYSEELDKPKLSDSDFTIGLHMGATHQAIDIVLSYYINKFGINHIKKDGEILKYY